MAYKLKMLSQVTIITRKSILLIERCRLFWESQITCIHQTTVNTQWTIKAYCSSMVEYPGQYWVKTKSEDLNIEAELFSVAKLRRQVFNLGMK